MVGGLTQFDPVAPASAAKVRHLVLEDALASLLIGSEAQGDTPARIFNLTQAVVQYSFSPKLVDRRTCAHLSRTFRANCKACQLGVAGILKRSMIGTGKEPQTLSAAVSKKGACMIKHIAKAIGSCIANQPWKLQPTYRRTFSDLLSPLLVASCVRALYDF